MKLYIPIYEHESYRIQEVEAEQCRKLYGDVILYRGTLYHQPFYISEYGAQFFINKDPQAIRYEYYFKAE